MRATGPAIYGKLFATAFLWGGTFVAARIVARHAGPFSASFLRFAIASLCLAAVMAWRDGALPRLQKRQVIPVFLLGMTGVFAYNVFFFLGLKTVTASRASLIVASNPVLIALLSAPLFGERLSPIRLAGIALSLSGAALVISRGDPLTLFTGGIGWGELLVLGCVASWVAYTLIGRAVLRDMDPLKAVTASCVAGTVALAVPALMEGIGGQIASYRWMDWTGIAYLGVFGTVAGFLWYYEGIRAIGAGRAAVFINFVPVSGVFLGWLILDEAIGWSLIAGAALVIGGVFLTNRQP